MTTVRELRARTGLTQKEFSLKYNIPFGTLADWEIGRTKPKPYILNLLERFVTEDEDATFNKPIVYGVNFSRLLDITRMSKAEFARRYGINQSTVRMWDRNDNSWRINLLERAVREDIALGK